MCIYINVWKYNHPMYYIYKFIYIYFFALTCDTRHQHPFCMENQKPTTFKKWPQVIFGNFIEEVIVKVLSHHKQCQVKTPVLYPGETPQKNGWSLGEFPLRIGASNKAGPKRQAFTRKWVPSPVIRGEMTPLIGVI